MRWSVGCFGFGGEEGAGLEREERTGKSIDEVASNGVGFGVSLRGFELGLLGIPGTAGEVERGWKRAEENRWRY